MVFQGLIKFSMVFRDFFMVLQDLQRGAKVNLDLLRFSMVF